MRVHEPRRQRQRSSGIEHLPRGRGGGQTPEGRRHRRRHGGQHGNWSRGRRGDAGRKVRGRHPGDADGGEEGLFETAGGEGRRGAGGALQIGEQLPKSKQTSGGGARRRLGEPVRQRREPRRARPDDGAGNLAPDGGPRRRVLLRRGHGRDPRGHGPVPAGGVGRARAHRADGPAGRGFVSILPRRRARQRGRLDHGGRGPGAHHRQLGRVHAGRAVRD
mmetsp:Transcript_11166/g.32987  ORF Transcript_11166/g.32987 Transcript_11166/m.32987 type:complete len:219 (+) Transcript_11166:232-888(+)